MQVFDKGKPSFERLDVLDTKVISYSIDELNFAETIGMAEEEYWDKEKAEPIYPDYWTRLEHQYAGMAMQGIVKRAYNAYCDDCANYENMIFEDAQALLKDHAEALADVCVEFAHALVEQMKEEMK